jgi:hypothetical protein
MKNQNNIKKNLSQKTTLKATNQTIQDLEPLNSILSSKESSAKENGTKESSTKENNNLLQIKADLLGDIKIYLMQNKAEVSGLEKIDDRTQIAGDFFDDYLVGRVLAYIPIDLKDILNLCLEEPNIIASLARFSSCEPSTLTIIKDAIHYYLKDYIYRQLGKFKNG